MCLEGMHIWGYQGNYSSTPVMKRVLLALLMLSSFSLHFRAKMPCSVSTLSAFPLSFPNPPIKWVCWGQTREGFGGGWSLAKCPVPRALCQHLLWHLCTSQTRLFTQGAPAQAPALLLSPGVHPPQAPPPWVHPAPRFLGAALSLFSPQCWGGLWGGWKWGQTSDA